MADNYKHKSVLLDEAVELLLHNPDGCYIDGTFGRGGHSSLILQGLSSQGELQAFDKDPQAITAAKAMAATDKRLQIAQTSFANLQQIAAKPIPCNDNECLGLSLSCSVRFLNLTPTDTLTIICTCAA